MKNKMTITVCILLSAMFNSAFASVGNYTLPTSGNFFYAGLKYKDGQNFISLQIGSQNQTQNYLFNSEELTLSMFTEQCVNEQPDIETGICDVVYPYEYSKDTDANRTWWKDSSIEPVYIYNKGDIQFNQFAGALTSTHFNITMPDYVRTTTINSTAMEVRYLEYNYSSSVASGFIGIAPYTAIYANEFHKSSNVTEAEHFIYQLWNNSYIDRQIISFYVNSNNNSESFVKFGGYDPYAAIGDILLFRTNNTNGDDTDDNDSWLINSKNTALFGTNPNGNVLNISGPGINVMIEPAFPYLYAPPGFFVDFTKFIGEQGIIKNVISFDKSIIIGNPCDQVETTPSDNITFFFDDDQKIPMGLTFEELLIPSEQIDPNVTGKCYLGIFLSEYLKHDFTIYVGQLFLNKYYTVFDASGLHKGEIDSLVVGLGLKNPNANILQAQYNNSYPSYSPHQGDISNWTYNPNILTDPNFGKPERISDADKEQAIIALGVITTLIIIVLVTMFCCWKINKVSQKELEEDDPLKADINGNDDLLSVQSWEN